MTALKRRLVSPLEVLRRRRGRGDGRLRSLPILALSVHSACNCCCVMCDIWKANAERREISAPDLDRHVDAIRKLAYPASVQRLDDRENSGVSQRGRDTTGRANDQ